jgi:hypothetical protein
MHPHVSGTERVGFLKARRSWEPGSQNSDIRVKTWNPGHGDSQIRQNLNLRVRTWNPVQPLNFHFSAICGRHLLWSPLDVVIIRLFLRACFPTTCSPTAPYFGWCLGGVTFNLKMSGQFLCAVPKICAVGQKNITNHTQKLNFACSWWEGYSTLE